MAEFKVNEPVMGRRAFVGGSLAAGSLAFLAACGQKGDGAGSGDAPATDGGKTLNYYINNPVCIDPYNVQEDQGTQVEFQLFDTLMQFDFENNELKGLAAESFDATEDATEFTFHLVEGAKFHNGDPVTAQDFVRGWTRLVSPKSAIATEYGPSEISYHLSVVEGYDALANGETDEFSGLSCPDDNTLVVKLSSAYADFAYIASHPALSPVPACAEEDAKNFYLAPVGNGPFMMKPDTKWEDGQYIDIVKFDDYYGEPAKIDGVHFIIQKDIETAYKEFQAGNLDVCDVPVAQIEAARKERGEAEYTMEDGKHMLLGAEPSAYYLVVNNNDEQFKNPDLRKGVSLAINREAICETLFKGTRTPADGIIPPGIDGYTEGAWEFSAYDVDKANEYLDKVAPMSGDSRGINVVLTYNQDGGHKEIMESVIGDLAKVGITAESETPEWSAVLEQYTAGTFQFGRLGWIADYPIMDNFLYPLFHSDSIGGDNKSGYSNAEVDKLIDEARATTDDDARIAKMKEADAIIASDCPVIPLMFYTHTLVGSDRIKNLYVDPQKKADLATCELA
ncbi:peptide ABC transporter substrate-binding protein [Collinsella phocaeensis]|uniref:peptide ABC transporter substrate-binding protein n=1 Tax=Collinsella phocaeensis TaxID=1871016 RepID=UPI000930287C|nr:ABC transporter substrate-binding protein [Collinsella phocaeensis]